MHLVSTCHGDVSWLCDPSSPLDTQVSLGHSSSVGKVIYSVIFFNPYVDKRDTRSTTTMKLINTTARRTADLQCQRSDAPSIVG